MRLKLDENIGIRWRDRLTEAAHDVDTVHDEDLSGSSDLSMLDAATSANRALVTLDVDFANPIRFPPRRTPGIAVLRVHDRPGRRDLDLVVAELILGLMRASLTGHLQIVKPDRIRQYQEDAADEE